MLDLLRRLMPGALVAASAQVDRAETYNPRYSDIPITLYNPCPGLNGLEMMCGRLEEETYELIIR